MKPQTNSVSKANSVKLVKLKTLGRLGLANLFRVAWYRFSIRMGLSPVHKLKAEVPHAPFLTLSHDISSHTSIVIRYEVDDEKIELFGSETYSLRRTHPPDWFESPFTNDKANEQCKNWWEISDFDTSVGDIKQLWELSRFDWVLKLVQLARVHAVDDPSRSSEYEQQLNSWLADWIQHNPPYTGVNWKCGQEASIRVMHLICGAKISGSLSQPPSGLLNLIELHLQRIAPTMSYAVAQDNNHGTSEAAALFVGGSFLAAHGSKAGSKWARKGRKWLENRAAYLIATDGSFSQYSINYHRMMLDTLSFSETARGWFGAPKFTSTFYSRALAATNWLAGMTDGTTGDVPNLGANDGARLFPLTNTDYRDYRPSLVWAYKVFADASPMKHFMNAEESEAVLFWLDLPPAEKEIEIPRNMHAEKGGFVAMRCGKARVIVNYPRFQFRPSQNDLLHVDLWVDSENLLRDAGSYSYNCEEPWQSYFPSTAAHNTVQFDERDQMPRISRFLLGAWPKAKGAEFEVSKDALVQKFRCSYKDYLGAIHHRKVELNAYRLVIRDIVSGFKQKAVARYRLSPERDWKCSDNVVSDGRHTLTFEADVSIDSIRIVDGWESRYYFHKSKVPVVEVTLTKSGSLTMEYQWA
ncbi:heparinase II/III-family protein [Pseudidiomarina halophila]|uniref:heparinase II/III family protein n=1 Tax=Pseudidiomarina halophila TaxID=1449799 RepID=UPI0026CDF4AA